MRAVLTLPPHVRRPDAERERHATWPLAMRRALGASRARLVQQLLVEAAMLATGGAVVGALLAAWTNRLLQATFPSSVPVFALHVDLSLDWRAVVFTSIFSTLGIPLVAGQEFTPASLTSAQASVIVDESLGRLAWPNGSPIGQHVDIGCDTRQRAVVVGVRSHDQSRCVPC